MSDLEKVFENIRIPNLFRDILFLLGGTVTIPMVIYLLAGSNSADFYKGANALFELDANFFSAIFFLAISYLVGRFNDVLADIFYSVFKFLYKIMPFVKADQKSAYIVIPSGKIDHKGAYWGQIKLAAKEFFDVRVRDNPYQKAVGKSRLNFVRMTSQLQGNRWLADNMERSIYSDIVYSQIFVIAGLASYYLSAWFGLICLLMIFKKYHCQNNLSGYMNEIKKEIERGDDIDWANRELAPVISGQE